MQKTLEYNLNTHNRIDATIKNENGSVAVMFEAKKPQNINEMITLGAPNRKALHESVYYYMQERENGNDEIKRIVITNGFEWFIFDAADFEKLFWQNADFKKRFRDFEKGVLTSDKNEHFYNDIAKSFINGLTVRHNLLIEDAILEPLHFDVRMLNEATHKIAFFKALSKPYLLNEPTAQPKRFIKIALFCLL